MGSLSFLKTKWQTYDLLTLVIADDSIFGHFSQNPYNRSPEFSTLIDALKYLDSILKTDAWQSSVFPMLTTAFIESNISVYKQIFPGIIPISRGTVSSPTNLYYGDLVIPTQQMYIWEYSFTQGYIKFSKGKDSDKYGLPYINSRSAGENTSSGGTTKYLVGCGVILTKESCVSNGVFNNLSPENCCGCFIEIRQWGNDKWQAYANKQPLYREANFSFWNGKEVKEWSSDPFNPGGNTESGGGGGSFDNTSTPIDIPGLPTVSAASTGFISLFNPTLSQLNQLASYMWSDLFQIDGWKKLFADPMDAILGLSIVPVAVPSGGTREVKVGNIGTGISLTVASSQFVKVDCGTIDVNEYWGAYLDYEPYTQAQIFLPYIGIRPISVDDIMGKTVRVVYHVDILTGACCCFIKCGNSVLYTYNGQCSIPIPITGANYTSVVNGVISIAASVGSLVATGGASAPIAAPSIASSAVNQMKPQIEKSGSISGSAGVLNMQTPYLILIRPRQALPSKQNEFIGYPSLITVQLTELSGYTEVQSIHLENIPATQEELAEIQSLLEGGVIF